MPVGRTKASVPFPPRQPRPAANWRPESDTAAHASPATPPTAAKWRRKRAVRLPRGKRRASEAESTRIAANWHPEFDARRGRNRESRFRKGFTANRCKPPSGERLTVWLLTGIALPTLICSIPRRSAVRSTIQFIAITAGAGETIVTVWLGMRHLKRKRSIGGSHNPSVGAGREDVPGGGRLRVAEGSGSNSRCKKARVQQPLQTKRTIFVCRMCSLRVTGFCKFGFYCARTGPRAAVSKSSASCVPVFNKLQASSRKKSSASCACRVYPASHVRAGDGARSGNRPMRETYEAEGYGYPHRSQPCVGFAVLAVCRGGARPDAEAVPGG